MGTRAKVECRDTTAGNLADYVLSPFAADEVDAAEDAVARAADAVEAAVHNGFEAAMNVYNRPLKSDEF